MTQSSKDEARQRARELAQESLKRGDAVGWFERFYTEARGDEEHIPWADLTGHPLLVEWLSKKEFGAHAGRRALVIGCGLGEDAELLTQCGFETTAFDVAPTAIAWCKQRFPKSHVRYEAADLFAAPGAWQRAFDFVFESYTLQALPVDKRAGAFARIASFLAPRGELLVITRAREATEDPGQLPWPLTRDELRAFDRLGLRELSFEDLPDCGPVDKPGRHFRALWRAE